MTANETSIIATCHCKKHTFAIQVPSNSLPLPAQICHCTQCRHATGNICVQGVPLPSTVNTDMSGLSRYALSTKLSIHFCGTCGSKLFFNDHTADAGKGLTVFAGALDKVDDVIKFEKHIYISDTLDGGAANWLPRIGSVELKQYGERSNELPPRAVTLDADELPDTTTAEGEAKTLELKCLCGGVQAVISRPHLLNPKGTEMTEIFWLDTNDRFRALVCVCESCRKGVGGAFLGLGYVPSACIKQTGGAAFDLNAGTLKAYRSSEGATRYFCKACGAFAFFVGNANLVRRDQSKGGNGNEGLIGIGMGLLHSSAGAQANDWFIWRTHKIAFEGDTNHTAFRDGLKEGLAAWGRQRYGEGSVFLEGEKMLKISSKMSKAAGVGPMEHSVEQAVLVKDDEATA